MDTRYARAIGWVAASLLVGLVGGCLPLLTGALANGPLPPLPEGFVLAETASFDRGGVMALFLLSFVYVVASVWLPAWILLGRDFSAADAMGCLLAGLFVVLVTAQAGLVVLFRFGREATPMTAAVIVLVPLGVAAVGTCVVCLGLRRLCSSANKREPAPTAEGLVGR
jgi:hypothetical protein